jgi:hypothetical protein
MLIAEERHRRIATIRAFPRHLADALAGLSDSQLDTPYREGGWTVRQVVHHLADSHMHAYLRMKLIAAEENPPLKPYDQDQWGAMPDSRTAPLGSSLSILTGLHERWALFLERLDQNAWERTGNHPERGVVTLESMLATYAEHGRKHIRHITGLRQTKGW